MAPFSARLFVWRDPIQVGCLPVPMKRPRVLFAEKLLLGGLLKRAVDRPQILPIWGVLLRADTCSRIRTIRESRLQQADFRVDCALASRSRPRVKEVGDVGPQACQHSRAIRRGTTGLFPSLILQAYPRAGWRVRLAARQSLLLLHGAIASAWETSARQPPVER